MGQGAPPSPGQASAPPPTITLTTGGGGGSVASPPPPVAAPPSPTPPAPGGPAKAGVLQRVMDKVNQQPGSVLKAMGAAVCKPTNGAELKLAVEGTNQKLLKRRMYPPIVPYRFYRLGAHTK
jgi:hypothetical protein